MNNLPTWWTLWVGFIVLLAVLRVVILVVRIAIRIKRDGRAVTFETDKQRHQRHERERMDRWAERDRQRQRFQMATRRDDARPHRAAPRPVPPPPDIADPAMTQEDWIDHLTTE